MLDNKGFDLWADGYDRSVGLSDEDNTYPFAGYKKVLASIYDAIRTGLGKRVLDIGFGTGVLACRLYENGYLYSGDLIYEGTLFANYPSTDPHSYLTSLERVAVLPIKQIFPGHHRLDIRTDLVIQMRDAFRGLNEADKLYYGSGTHNFGDWAIAL